MLYDYDEDEQSRNGAKNPKGYSPMPKQNDTASAPAARPRLIQRLRGSGPSELHPLVFLEALLVGILLIVMLFIPSLGPLIGIAFSLLWGFLGYALGSSFARGIGPVNSMIIGGVAALIGFSVSLKAHLS